MKKLLISSRCAWTIYNFRRGIIKRAQKEGIKVYCVSMEDKYTPKLIKMGVDFIPLPLSKRGMNIFQELKLFVTCVKIIKLIKPDIIHNFTIKPVIYNSLASFFYKKPKIFNSITGLGYVFSDEFPGSLRSIIAILYKFGLKKSCNIFFQNKNDLDTFIKYKIVSKKNATLLPGSGVDLNYFSKKAINMDKIVLKPNMVKFIMVSRLLKSKGVYEFVEAAKIIKEKRTNVSFMLVGGLDIGNPESIDEKILNKWKNESWIDIVGEVEDVRPYLAASDVLVLPTRYKEGIPKSILEAGAMECCVITTNIAGCRDIIEDKVNGLLIDVEKLSVDKLSECMLILADDFKLLNKLKKTARKIVETEYDEKIVLDKIFYAYYSVL